MEPMTQVEYDEIYVAAQEAGEATMKCLCGERVFYRPDGQGFGPGHIYSEDGRTEMRISGCCEYHFDEMFGEDDE